MDIRQAHTLLSSLEKGQAVTITCDGRELELTVQRALHRPDPGGFGSWEHSAVTVGYGPGRYNTDVTPAGIAAGFYAVAVK